MMPVEDPGGTKGSVASTHRLPGISAANALRRLTSRHSTISSGSSRIDGLLVPTATPIKSPLVLGPNDRAEAKAAPVVVSEQRAGTTTGSVQAAAPEPKIGARLGVATGGLPKGKVTEVHGPAGSGKTTLGITAAVNALSQSGAVTWIDCATEVPTSRILEVAAASSPDSVSVNKDDQVSSSSSASSPITALRTSFHHVVCPTLSHLLSLLLHPPSGFPSSSSSLLVIDDISTLFTLAFPSPPDFPSSRAQPSTVGNGTSVRPEEVRQAASARRWALQRDVVTALGKLAAVHDLAVLVTVRMATRMDREAAKLRATLRPVLATRSWTDGIWARLLLGRFWGPKMEATGASKHVKSVTRFAALVKLGSTEHDTLKSVVMFDIQKCGIVDASLPSTPSGLSIGSASATQIRNIPTTIHTQKPHLTAPATYGDPHAPPRTGTGIGTGIGTGTVIPAKRDATAIADSESEDEDEDDAGVVDESESEVEEVNELGLTREQQDMLDWEVEEMQNVGDEIPGW